MLDGSRTYASIASALGYDGRGHKRLPIVFTKEDINVSTDRSAMPESKGERGSSML